MNKNTIYEEKYRPNKLNDIVGQDEIVERLKKYVQDKNLQHLMFTGLHGTGKTTAALCLAKELFGDVWSGNFKELNASDKRGIDTIRNDVKDFAKTAPLGELTFKIILLDEADSLTSDAQSALRRIIEKYSKTCIFILSCNYSSKIIGPIQSRLSVYKFKPVNKDNMIKRLKFIADSENFKIDNEALEAIVYIADGDMRKAVNTLQTSTLMIDKNNENDIINIDKVYTSSGSVKKEIIEELIEIALKGEIILGFNKLDIILIEYGLSGDDLCIQLVKAVMNMNISDITKVMICDIIGEIDFRLIEGANERIQMRALIAKIMLIGKENCSK